MDHDLRSLCTVEARRLVLLILLLVASALVVQYYERPYGTAMQFIFSSYPDVSGNFTGMDTNVHLTNNSLVFDENQSDPEDESPSEDLVHAVDNSTVDGEIAVDTLPPVKSNTSAYGFSPNSMPTGNNSLTDHVLGSNVLTDKNGSVVAGPASPPLTPPSLSSTPNFDSAVNLNTTPSPLISVFSNASSTTTAVNIRKSGARRATKGVVSISDMNDLLLRRRASSFSMKPQWSSAADKELRNVKVQIENAPRVDNHPELYAPLYRNISTFKRSYELMEQMLRVYIYKEGERPIFHTPILKGIYASEGWFMKVLKANKNFVTKNPKRAHLFYLPFSSRMLEVTLYVPNSHVRKNLVQCLKDYVDVISTRHNFWNRTRGADHFLVACHDWAPAETRELMGNCIRALCNADAKGGFKFGDDVSLPETYVKNPKNPLRELGGRAPSQRKILAFFAGNMHGYLRPILLQHWENKDPDMKIFGRIPKSNYVNYMKTSKYCVCAKGYEVNSPRVVEAIFYECVPVIISDNYVPPLFSILNWESFALFVPEKDIPNLKNILVSIPKKRYLEMYKRVKLVQQHFLWHVKPVKYDVFHMILHSIWYNRVLRAG